MEYYRNVDIERDETVGEAEREEEFPEILGGVEIPPSPHTVLPTTGDGDIVGEVAEPEEETVEVGEPGDE
jgi:hypothetical protein